MQPDRAHKLESFLRQMRVEAPVSDEHKRKLRGELFTQPRRKSIGQYWHVFANAAALAIAAVVIYINIVPGPVVGHFTNGEDLVVREGKVYTQHDDTIVMLDDGSRLAAQSGSRFIIRSSSTGRVQEDAIVQIVRGTIDFDVSHEKDYAFIVKTPDMKIKVIGTKFQVSVTKQ